jgi:hypothetical protein
MVEETRKLGASVPEVAQRHGVNANLAFCGRLSYAIYEYIDSVCIANTMPSATPTSWHFARPDLAEHHLRALDLGLISATALHARRRMGKTEFLTQDLTPAARQRGYVVGYCNLWQEEHNPLEAIAEAVMAASAPQRILGKIRAKIKPAVASVKVSGKLPGVVEGGAELGFKESDRERVSVLRTAFAAFDKSRNKGLLLIDEAQVLADRQHRSLEKALRALLDTRKERLKVIFTGSSEDRLRTMFGLENKAFYNWARVEPLPLLGEEFVRELTRRANALTTLKLQLEDTLRAFDALKQVPELFRRFLSQYLANAFEGVDRAIEGCKQSVYREEGFAKRWQALLPADRLILLAVAKGEPQLIGRQSLARLGRELKLGRAASRAVPQNSLKRLRDRQVLIQTDTGVYRFEDETFREWIVTELPAGDPEGKPRKCIG